MESSAKFSEFLRKTGRSESTIRIYHHDASACLSWLEGNKLPMDSLSRDSVLKYLKYLKERPFSNKTIKRYISSIIKYNEYLIATGFQTGMVLSKSDFPDYSGVSSLNNISKEEVDQFLLDVMKAGNLRNYTLVLLLATTGLRLSEALNLKGDNINLKDGTCNIDHVKTSKSRKIVLNPEVISVLNQYMSKLDNVSSDYLFKSNRNRRLNETVVNRVFKHFSDIITPRQLRYYYCLNLIEQGMNIYAISDIMGHSGINTTLSYIKTKLIF